MGDILEITGVKQMAQWHQPLKKERLMHESIYSGDWFYTKIKRKMSSRTRHPVIPEKSSKIGNFSLDETKKNIDIEKVLLIRDHARASDIHLATNKPITYRIEGVLIKMENEPVLTADHLSQIKTAILQKHQNYQKNSTKCMMYFGYITKKVIFHFELMERGH